MNIYPLKLSIVVIYDFLLAPGIIASHLSPKIELQGKIKPDSFPGPVIGSLQYGENLLVDITDGKKLLITHLFNEKRGVEGSELDPNFGLLLNALLEYFSGSAIEMFGINVETIVSGNDELERLIPLEDTESVTFSELKLTRKFKEHQVRLSVARVHVEKPDPDVSEFPLRIHYNHHFDVTQPKSGIDIVLKEAVNCYEYLQATREITEGMYDQIRGSF